MSGGQMDSEPCTAASAMKAYAVVHGVLESDVLEQGDAIDTVAEAICSRLLLPPLPASSRHLIITSAFHLKRAARIFRFVYGANFELAFEGVPDGPEEETAGAAKEAASLKQFEQLFAGIRPGDIEAIVTRFWQDHALYQGAQYAGLRRKTRVDLAVNKET
jgi:hypothetical protein